MSVKPGLQEASRGYVTRVKSLSYCDCSVTSKHLEVAIGHQKAQVRASKNRTSMSGSTACLYG